VYPAVLLMYFISAAVILLASLAFTQFQLTEFQTFTILNEVNNLNDSIFETRRIFSCRNESAMRPRWRKNTTGQ
jgi:hypothetical protein